MPKVLRAQIQRFSEKTRVVGDCIEWTGTIDKYGYGQFRPTGGSNMGAHRWSYEYHVGPIPEGLQIDHVCRNRKCVNPEHLEPVTARENLFRSPIAPAALNAAKTHCLRNHPLSGENLYLHPNSGRRGCRECRRMNDRQRKQAVRNGHL